MNKDKKGGKMNDPKTTMWEDGKMKIEKKWGYMIINGKYFESEEKHGRTILKEVPGNKLEEMEKKARKITGKLKGKLDTSKILMEALMTIDRKDLNKLHGMLFESKKKYQPKTRAGHCVDMKIGNFVLPIVD